MLSGFAAAGGGDHERVPRVAEEASRPAEEDAKLGAVFQDYLKELFRREPLTATRLGEHAYDDQLDDLSAEARKATVDFKQKVYEKLGLEIAVDKLSPDGTDRLRDLPQAPGARGLAGPELPPVRGGSEDLWGLHLRERLPPADPVVAPQAGQSQERPGPDAEDPFRDGDGPADDRKPAPGSRSRRRSGRPKEPSGSTR